MLVLAIVVLAWLLIGVVAVARAEYRKADGRSPLAAAIRAMGKVLTVFVVGCATEIGMMMAYLFATHNTRRLN